MSLSRSMADTEIKTPVQDSPYQRLLLLVKSDTRGSFDVGSLNLELGGGLHSLFSRTERLT